jgi:hypothetical protein
MVAELTPEYPSQYAAICGPHRGIAALPTLRTLARQIWHRAVDVPEPEPLTAEQAPAAMAAALAARARSRPVDGFS